MHGGSHIWIWRPQDGEPYVLLQKRAASKLTWPNCYDISAAGHIDLGETPLQAALREIKEEIGLNVAEADLKCFGVSRDYMVAPTGAIENEFRWLYTLQLTTEASFTLQSAEVADVEWMPLSLFKTACGGEQFVPHPKRYYDRVVEAIEAAAQREA